MVKRRDSKIDFNKIREVLNEEWNPIGFTGPPDEYDSYIGKIYQMIQTGASAYELATHLEKLETIAMGLKSNPEANQRVAKKLLNLFRSE